MYVLIVSTIFTVLSTICVVLRLWTRFWLIRAPGLDDLFITGALVRIAMGSLASGRAYHLKRACILTYNVHQAVNLPFYAFTLIGK
jgi:hypothetical protein